MAGGTLTGALNGTTAAFSGAVSGASAAFSGVAAAADPPAIDSSSKLVTTAWFGSHLPATKENSNRIINGDMRIDQRNQGASGTGFGYCIDRWSYSSNQATKGTWQRSAQGASGIATNGCGYNLLFTSSSAYSALAGDNFGFFQRIEADMIGDFAWGTTGAQPVTLSFWVTSSLTWNVWWRNSKSALAGTRSYPFAFNIPIANAWTKVVITIPGDTAGTWILQGNAAGLILIFDLGSGSTFRGPAGAWASNNYWSVPERSASLRPTAQPSI